VRRFIAALDGVGVRAIKKAAMNRRTPKAFSNSIPSKSSDATQFTITAFARIPLFRLATDPLDARDACAVVPGLGLGAPAEHVAMVRR